jgi:hypothetical protein
MSVVQLEEFTQMKIRIEQAKKHCLWWAIGLFVYWDDK